MFLPIEPGEVPDSPCEVVKYDICPSSMGCPPRAHTSVCATTATGMEQVYIEIQESG
jgi:hypothetical protein